MKKFVILGVLFLIPLCTYAQNSWVAESKMIEASRNFALVVSPEVQQTNIDSAMRSSLFAYRTRDNVNQAIANSINAGWTCDNASNAIGGKVESLLRDNTLTEAQHKMFKLWQASIINYIQNKCPELGGN